MKILSTVFLALLPLVVTARVHKLKLQKIEPVASNSEFEASYLAQKYGAPNQVQLPMMGAGGAGRRIQRPTTSGDEPLFWTQESTGKGGHSVPLTGSSVRVLTSRPC